MDRENLLKELIKEKYGSVLKFSKEAGIPESSIRNIFSRGMDSVSAGTLVEICKKLSIDMESLMSGSLSVRPNWQKDAAMSTGKRIKECRERNGITQEELGAACNTTKQTIFKYENGVVTNIPIDRLARIAGVLGVAPAYLMGWQGSAEENLPPNIIPMPAVVKRPRLGVIACGKPILAVEEAEEFDEVPSWVECDFTLKCKGDSMINARIYDGDTVYIRSQPEVENGQIAAVRIGDEATLKRVYYNGGRIILRACNPLYPDMEFDGEQLEDIQVLGRAVAFTSTIKHM